MPDDESQKIVPKGFFKEIGLQIKLILRLMGDRRVSPLLKAIPLGTLVYLVVPDLLPAVPFDDMAVIGLGLYLFVELCPPAVVDEHRQALLKEMLGSSEPRGDVIEGEFRDMSGSPGKVGEPNDNGNTGKE